MKVNNKFIQIRGKVETDTTYSLGDELNVTVCVTDIQDKDNFDSTIDRTYKARLVMDA